MNEMLRENFTHLRRLANDIDSRLNADTDIDRGIRNELAGMFAVTIVATYEGIIKATLIDYAGRIHPKYGLHIESDFAKSNARVTLDDLKKYSLKFGLDRWEADDAPKNATVFHQILARKRPVVERRFRKDMIGSYSNLFIWRNAYAHERSTSATLKDVYDSHRVAQHVVKCFVNAFGEG